MGLGEAPKAMDGKEKNLKTPNLVVDTPRSLVCNDAQESREGLV